MAGRYIKLFHGSKSGIKGKIRPISRELCDFGKGFYMGTEQEQPMTLICNYENATMYELELDAENLIVRNIPLDIDWALFVAFNRGRLTKEIAPVLYEKYVAYKENVDVFKGYIANDRMFVVLDRFFDGDITDVALVESLSALKLGIQYVAVTQKACDAISIKNEQKLTVAQKEKLILRSEDNRKLGISLANEICRKYRNTAGRECILTNSSNSFQSLSGFERQLCAVQGKMFELSAKKNLASKEFIDFYMQSNTAKFFDLPYDRTQWLGEENLLFDVLEENQNLVLGKIYDSESLFWIGYIYRYWHFLTKQSSSAIGKKCNAEMMYALYPAYHTLDCAEAIERILEA